MDFFWENEKNKTNIKLFNPNKVIEFPSIDFNYEELYLNKISFNQIQPLIALDRVEKGNNILNELTKIFQVNFIIYFIYLFLFYFIFYLNFILFFFFFSSHLYFYISSLSIFFSLLYLYLY